MSDAFDPYHKWLAIPPAEQPPNFYRLLGIALYETDQEAIAAGAVQRIDWVRKFESGAYPELAKQIREEISAAWMCLRNVEQKQRYDEQLRRQLDGPPANGPSVPRTLFAEAVSSPMPATLEGIPANPFPGDIKRTPRSKSSSGLNILLQASAGPIGLVLGYILLCQFGPQYDFLGIWHRSEQSKGPVAAASAPGKELGWPNQRAAPKLATEKPQEPTVQSRPKPTPSPASAGISSKADSGTIEVATRSPIVEPAIPAPSSRSEVPSKNNNEPSSGGQVEMTPGGYSPPVEPSKIRIETVGELQKAIAKCRTASEVLQLLRAPQADPGILDDTRNYASAQLPVWEDRVVNDYVRLGEVWMPRTAALAARNKANDLIVQAAGLLSLENDQSALERLQEAARVDPEATSALFLLGAHYALGLKNYQEAKVCFNNCLRRRPDDAGALNNVALAYVMLGKYAEGLRTFRAAVASNSRSPEVVHNLRRVLKQDGLKILVLPPTVKKGFVELLNDAVNDQSVTALESYGWLYMLPAPAPAFTGLPAEASDVLPRFAQSKTNKTVKMHAQSIEDCQCLWCLGVGKVPCPNPDCSKGKTTVITGQERTGTFDLITMQPVYRNKTESRDCSTCNGKGYVACDKCTGRGTDPTVSDIRIDVSKQ